MDELSGWVQSMGQFGALGVVTWLVYYYTTVTLPKAFDKIDAISDKHNASVEKVCDDFRQSLREERESRRQELAELKAGFRCTNHSGN